MERKRSKLHPAPKYPAGQGFPPITLEYTPLLPRLSKFAVEKECRQPCKYQYNLFFVETTRIIRI